MPELARKNDDWFFRKWRPAMAWMYMAICIFDFIIGPIFYAWFAWYTKDLADFGEWQPLTLMGGALFHASMGAIIGVSAWGRTQEKLNGVNAPPPGIYNSYQTNKQYETEERIVQKETTHIRRPNRVPKSDEPLI